MAAPLLEQRGRLLLWIPLFLSLGIGLWFSLRAEPQLGDYLVAGGLAGGLILLARLAGEALSPICHALALVLIGALLAGARAHLVAEPVLGFRYYGPIEGRVVGIDRSASDKLRLTLDQVVLARTAPDRTPARVRISLHAKESYVTPMPGMVVMTTGHLSPPGGPVEPGGFDFRRKAWFERLGAVGYTRNPLLMLEPAAEGQAGVRVFRLRMAISRAVQARLPGQAGAFAAAVLTGDRSGIDREVLDALRVSNLAHLLAISGLHMGLLTGVVFTVLRIALALVPYVALRWPCKKLAAAGALAAATGYLALSGGNVSTQRAFVMVTVMLVAVLLGRRAISLRAVAIAATIVLVLTPEALFGPGFQMSFAATTALVAVFGWLRDHPAVTAPVPRWLRPALAVVISSAVAGLATAPFAAAHFNRIADYGLIANLMSVPVMGVVVMPGAVLAAALWPLGLSSVGLWVMELGLRWILAVAGTVASWDGAATPVITPDALVLPLLSGGVLVWLIWSGPARHLGALPVIAAAWLWTATERPAVLVSESGGLVGVMTAEGRALSKSKGDGFAARVWLENDGDAADQAEAAQRAGFNGSRGAYVVELGAVRLTHISGRNSVERALATCASEPGLLVVNKVIEDPAVGRCTLVDLAVLRRQGALGVWLDADKARLVWATELSGVRMWNARQGAHRDRHRSGDQ